MNLKLNMSVIFMLIAAFSFAQKNSSIADTPDKTDEFSVKYKYDIGASLFMLGNFLEESPDYYLLTFGYRLTKKDRIFTEFNTWRYSEPLGTYTKSIEFYPGFVRAWGLGIGYQRFLWKGLYGKVQATPFLKQYHDINNLKTQKGFQLYLQLVAGYRFQFFKERFFIEPAWALKYWPVDTNYPAEFAAIEKGAPKYIFEPSANFGFRF